MRALPRCTPDRSPRDAVELEHELLPLAFAQMEGFALQRAHVPGANIVTTRCEPRSDRGDSLTLAIDPNISEWNYDDPQLRELGVMVRRGICSFRVCRRGRFRRRR